MKKILFLFMLALGAGMANAQQVIASANTKATVAAFTWDEQSFDFGKIAKGKPVTHEFEFTNTGGAPLVIANVKSPCGCTTPEWTKEPIPVGGSGYIKATFNAASAGAFTKTISISANVNAAVTLTIKGVVE